MEALIANTAEIRGLSFFGRKAKLFDVLAASPLILWYGWSFVYQAPGIYALFQSIHSSRDVTFALLDLLSKLALFGFGGVLVVLLIARRPAIKKHTGWAPRIIALLGCYLGIAFLVFPVAPPHSVWLEVSAFLIFSGMSFSLFSVFWLGRSFSILPESRKLVTTGPYMIVRHPLYLGEQVALVGVALLCTSAFAAALFVLQACCQLYRMSYEENILKTAFPEYEAYSEETARILPWLY